MWLFSCCNHSFLVVFFSLCREELYFDNNCPDKSPPSRYIPQSHKGYGGWAERAKKWVLHSYFCTSACLILFNGDPYMKYRSLSNAGPCSAKYVSACLIWSLLDHTHTRIKHTPKCLAEFGQSRTRSSFTSRSWYIICQCKWELNPRYLCIIWFRLIDAVLQRAASLSSCKLPTEGIYSTIGGRSYRISPSAEG